MNGHPETGMNGHPENRPRPLGSYDPGETFLLGWGERAAVVAAARQLAAALSADELSEVGLQSARIGLPYAVTADRDLVLPDAQGCVRWLEQLIARLGAGDADGSPQISYAELVAARNVVVELLFAVQDRVGLPTARLDRIAREVSPGSHAEGSRQAVTRLLTTLRDRLSEHLPKPTPGRYDVG